MRRSLPITIAVLCMLILVLVGTSVRLNRLGTRLYWADEVVTSLRVAGYTMDDVKSQLFDGRKHTVAEALSYQTPSGHGTASNIVRSLALEDAQHPPLYYLFERSWIAAFGNDVAVRRSLSVLFSLLTLPALYWLSRELFDSPFVAYAAVGLAAISPLAEIYARQAREYSLWELLIVCSSAATVRATKGTQDIRWWGLTFVSLVLSAYTFLFGIFGAISSGIYAAAFGRLRLNRVSAWGVSTALVACMCFAPWLYQIYSHRDRIIEANVWSSQSWPPAFLFAKLLLNMVSPFYDVPLYNVKMAILAIPILLFIVWSLYLLFRSGPREAKILVASLLLPTIVFVIVPDFLTHAHRSSVTRYLMPVYVALQLAVAFAIVYSIERRRSRTVGCIAVAMFVALEMHATLLQNSSDIWWDNQSAWPVPQIADHVNHDLHAVSDASDWPTLLALAPSLGASQRLLLGDVSAHELRKGDFLISPSVTLLQALRDQGVTLDAMPMIPPLQNSAHAIGSAKLSRAKAPQADEHATLYQVTREAKHRILR